MAGHGTFIAGLVHQACPDADIVAWRIVSSDGLIEESDLLKALEDIAELARRHRDGEPGGFPIDVFNLSMGYYHETPEDTLFDPEMYNVLAKMGECGVAVVCSAGQRRHRPADVPGGMVAVARRGRNDRQVVARHRAHRVGRGPEPQRHRRPVQQRWTVGARLRLRGVGHEHAPAFQGVCSPRLGPSSTNGSASRSTPTTTEGCSRCGAGRPSRLRSSPARSLATCAAPSTQITTNGPTRSLEDGQQWLP